MKVGMLLFDNNPRLDLAAKIAEASSYYLRKYGRQPDLVYVHPSMIQNVTSRMGGMEVRSTRMIQPNHLWIGIRETN